jgi:exodeoxyribonuclease VII small subunit
MSDETSSPETYEAAAERLEEVIRRLDSGQAGLSETLELCREGKELVEYCAGELDTVGESLKELRLEELVAKLEAAPAALSAEPPADGD